MTKIRHWALAKQVAAIPFHFLRHQWKHDALSKPEKYSFGRHWRQYLMFWTPPENIERNETVIVFYHGGGWRLGWPDQFPTLADWFLRRGYVVAMPAYRLLPLYKHPAMREDLNLAIHKILELLEWCGFSKYRIVVAGMSAGATLAAHLAFNRRELVNIGIDQARFAGFASFGGPLDLEKMPLFGPVRWYAGGIPGSDAFASANPMSWLQSSENLPLLIVHGTDDAIVPVSSSINFFDRYPGPKTFYAMKGGSHLDSLAFALNNAAASAAVEQWLSELK